MTRIFFKKGQSVAVKRMGGKKSTQTDKAGKQYAELDEEGVLLYQLLSDGFLAAAKEKARDKIIKAWEAESRRKPDSVKP